MSLINLKPGRGVFKKTKIIKKKHKKHVETMFLTQKTKKHKFYYKPNTLHLKQNPEKLNFLKKKVFYIRSLSPMYLTLDPLKAIVRICKWFTKNNNLEEFFKFKIHVFPDFVLTAKPKDVRMGKGKGAPATKVCLIKKGQVIFSLKIANFKKNFFLANALLKQIIHKLPNNYVVSHNFW